MFGRMFRVVSKQLGKSILGYLTMYPRINGQVSKDTLPSKLYFCLYLSFTHYKWHFGFWGCKSERGRGGKSCDFCIFVCWQAHTCVPS